MSSHILLSREVPSGREEIVALPRLLQKIRPQLGLDDTRFFNLVVALTEAVNNAIVHGNESDPAKHVRYSVTIDDTGCIECVIEDEGKGFEANQVADPTDPANLMCEGGRGVFLIQALMQDVRIERMPVGMRVVFVVG